MVNPGSRSTGCGRCRKRRIKCDETKPNCHRCQKIGVACPGYYRPLELRRYVDARLTNYTYTNAKQDCCNLVTFDGNVKPVSATCLSEPGHMSPNRSPSPTSEELQRLTVRLNQQLEPLWEDESLFYFLGEHCIPQTPGIFPGFMDFLPRMLSKSQPSSVLSSASLASACLSLSRRSKSPILYRKACEHYGSALSTLRMTLDNSSAASHEESLVAMALMDLFEDLNWPVVHKHAPHLHGVLRLFRARNQTVLNISSLSPVYRLAITSLQSLALTTGETFHCIEPPDDELEAHTLPNAIRIIASRVAKIFSDTVNLTSRMDHKSELGAELQMQLQQNIQQAMRVRARIDQWSRWLAATLKPKTVCADNDQQLIVAPTRLLGIMWMTHATMLMILSKSVLYSCRAAQRLQASVTWPNGVESIENIASVAQSQILQVSESICRSIPYNMGEVDEQGQVLSVPRYKASSAYYLSWPLALLALSASTTSAQLQVCTQTIEKIFSVYGMQLVHVVVALTKEECRRIYRCA